jgi:hypothetical protein
MKTFMLITFAFLCLVTTGCVSTNQIVTVLHQPDPAFRDLDNYGKWVDLPVFGTVWKPYIKHNWQPYAYGHCVWADRGWLWDSSEPFGWIVYHYGYWQFSDRDGWFWVPGYEWSPARVNWYCAYCANSSFETKIFYSHGFEKSSHADGFIGWAPAASPLGDNSLNYNKDYITKMWIFIAEEDFAGPNVLKYHNESYKPNIQDLHSNDSKHAPDLKEIQLYTSCKVEIVKPVYELVNAGDIQLTRVKIHDNTP